MGICSIASIKPLYFAGTKILTDQWQVTLDITDKEHVIEKIPRTVIFMERKINLSWKNAPIICFFCEKTGYFKRNCPDLKEAKNNQNLLEELKEAVKEIETTTFSNNKNNSIKKHSDNRSPPEIVLFKDIENNIFLEILNNLPKNNSTYTE